VIRSALIMYVRRQLYINDIIVITSSLSSLLQHLTAASARLFHPSPDRCDYDYDYYDLWIVDDKILSCQPVHHQSSTTAPLRKSGSPSAVLGVVILSVRPSHACFVSSKEPTGDIFIPCETAIFLVSCCQRSRRNSNGVTLNGGAK